MLSSRTKLAMLTAALALIFLSLAGYVHSETLRHPYIGAVLEQGNTGWRVIRVDPSGHAAQGQVHPGDGVVSVDGIAAHTKYAGLTQTSLTQANTAVFQSGDGSVYELRFQATRSDIWKILFSMLLEALLLIIAWLAHRANPVSSTVRKFSLLNVVIALVILAVYSTEMAVSNLILALSSVWLPYLLLSFCVSFVLRAIPQAWARALTIIRVFSMLLSGCALWAVTRPAIPGWFRGTLHLILLPAMLLLLATIAIYWRSLEKAEKNHALVLAAGLTAGLLPYLLLYALPNLLTSSYVIAPEYALSGLVPLSVLLLYVLNKRSMADMQVYLPRMILHSVYYGGVFALFALAQRVKQPVGVVILFICFIAGTWAYRNAAGRTKQRTEGRKQWLERQAYTLSLQAANKQNIRDILGLICEMLHHIVDVEGICIIWQEDQNVQPIIHGTETYADLIRGITITDRDNLLMHPSLWNPGRPFAHVAALSAPADTGGEGYLCLGSKLNQSLFSSEEKQLVEDLCIEAVRLLVNARQMAVMHGELQLSKEQNAVYERHVSDIRSANHLLLEAQQGERIRLSYRLHDQLLQNLIFLARDLEELTDRGTVDSRRLGTWLKCLDTSQQEIRRLCDELYPHIVDKASLEESLQWLLRTVKDSSGLEVSLEYLWSAAAPPAPLLKSNLFRIIRELIHNVQKHAGASRLSVCFIQMPTEEICCTITDNGRGFDAAAFTKQLAYMNGGHLGLVSVNSQIGHLGGEMDILSGPGQGTVITLRLPPQYNCREEQRYG
ncbi:sensor histidine kinase [Paenibacillus tengchongensis]|uniref:sensor histidine kinase n=1 Tax=Paenibacillus tengchongensis TaxID=2608684 RepID=UPI00124D601A|nr:ATP-binding protein [Paenibacillus tengchongensis]